MICPTSHTISERVISSLFRQSFFGIAAASAVERCVLGTSVEQRHSKGKKEMETLVLFLFSLSLSLSLSLSKKRFRPGPRQLLRGSSRCPAFPLCLSLGVVSSEQKQPCMSSAVAVFKLQTIATHRGSLGEPVSIFREGDHLSRSRQGEQGCVGGQNHQPQAPRLRAVQVGPPS